MTTATKTRKSVKPARRVHLYGADSNPMLVEMTIGKETFAYWGKRIHADYGMGFEFRKCPDGVREWDRDAVYHVHYDPARKLSTCDCKGGSYNGHCKHQSAIVALIQSGKLPVSGPRQPEPKLEAKPAAATVNPLTVDPESTLESLRSMANKERRTINGCEVERIGSGWNINGQYAADETRIRKLLGLPAKQTVPAPCDVLEDL